MRWLHKNSMKVYAVPSSVAAPLLVKLCISLRSYSGQGAPPMYGNYETQRHWMELTIHVLPRQWYTYLRSPVLGSRPPSIDGMFLGYVAKSAPWSTQRGLRSIVQGRL